MSTLTSLIGGYAPTVGDEIVVKARVAERFSMTQLSGASLVTKIASDGLLSEVQVDDAAPPVDSAAADSFWERHEGAQLRARPAPGSCRDSEIRVVDKDDALLERDDPNARRGAAMRGPGSSFFRYG